MDRLTSDKDVKDMGKQNDYQVAMKWLESHDWDGDPEADSNLATICYVLQEIGEYENLKEQKRLLKLPCAVGDTVYRLCQKCGEEHEGSCEKCTSYQSPTFMHESAVNGCTDYAVWEKGSYPKKMCIIVPYVVTWNYIPDLLENLGKAVFATREEAEMAYEKLEDDGIGAGWEV